MANIQIYDDAGFGLNLQSGVDWLDIIDDLGGVTQFTQVAGQFPINIALTFGPGDFNGLLGFEFAGVNARLQTLRVTTPDGDPVAEGSALDALVSLTTNVENIELLSNPFDGSDELIGNSFADVINSGSGNDRLTGGAGNDDLDGGAGLDLAVYSGSQSSYTLTLSSGNAPGTATVTDRRADGNGVDTIANIEFLDFDTDLRGEPFDLQTFTGLTGVSGPDLESFIELYIAYFNRAPDAIGLNFWGTAFAQGTSLEAMATLFDDQPETRAAYPADLSNEGFATVVYDNVLGRIPDAAGFAFWVDALDSGAVGRDQFILAVLDGAKSALKPEEGQDFVDQQIADREFLANKTDIGAYFAVEQGMSDVANARAAMALFDGSAASIDAAVAAIDTFYAEALDPTDGEFLMPLVGVLDTPFSVA